MIEESNMLAVAQSAPFRIMLYAAGGAAAESPQMMRETSYPDLVAEGYGSLAYDAARQIFYTLGVRSQTLDVVAWNRDQPKPSLHTPLGSTVHGV